MSIASLAEAKDYLNITAVNVDDELGRFIAAADPVIENIVGPVEPAEFDEFYDGGLGTIVLRHWPVISVESIKEYAGTASTTLTVAATPDLRTGTTVIVDPDGLLYRAGAGTVGCFATGLQNIRVQYTAGRDPTPPNVKLAALELIRHMYQSTQQSGRPAFAGALDDQVWAPAAFAVPTRVIELLEPYRREPRLA